MDITILDSVRGYRCARINGVECFRACDFARDTLPAEDYEMSSSLSNLFSKKHPDPRSFKIGMSQKIMAGWWFDIRLINEYGEHLYDTSARATAGRMKFGGMTNAKKRSFDKKAAAIVPEIALEKPVKGIKFKKAAAKKKAKEVRNKQFGVVTTAHTHSLVKMMADVDDVSMVDIFEIAIIELARKRLSA